MFTTTSRYANVADATYQNPNGTQVSYKILRRIPSAPAILAHTVVQQDRLDLLANTYYGDPQQFWRICDGNLAMRPDDVLVIGSQLEIPLVQR
ncbi:MAG: hypothetical protein LAQ69_23710 [Acidobacteriia bacterium]|nr:hypothetical protein [Terriglobia bacterium]